MQEIQIELDSGELYTHKDYFEKTRWNGADVDIFLHGITDQQEANAKIKALMDHFLSKLPKDAETAFVRTPNTVTLVSGDPRRHIQIITRLYRSPQELLNGFDIDCCCVGYNGKSVLATTRAANAIRYRVNKVNLQIRGPCYEERLIKYASRG